MILNIILIFIAGFITDAFWALYIKKISENRKLLASTYSAIIGLCNIIWVTRISGDDTLYLGLSYIAGLFLGTYFTLILNDKLNKKEKIKMKKHKRDKFERWIDKHNHKFELIRTIGSMGSMIGLYFLLRNN